MKYEKFEDWFDEIENYGMRNERFFDSLDQFTSKQAYDANLVLWLRAAFECGKGIDDERL
jgi:hypothetical protein